MRQIVLDTETTGLDPLQGHKIIEIGCVELVKRRPTRNTFHEYLNPQREIDEGALEVHGITQEFLTDKPLFADVSEALMQYLQGAELIIHNAEFDIGFLNHELTQFKSDYRCVEDHCKVLDTLKLARELHPGQRNSLDALCKRYQIDNAHRTLHGALLDAQILADVYLAMTGGQKSLLVDEEISDSSVNSSSSQKLSFGDNKPQKIVYANTAELNAHETWLDTLDSESGEVCVWRRDRAIET